MGFERSFEHSDALFQAALTEFVAKGYEQASINTILANAGMSKGQFYYHFKNKEGLYLALIGVLIEKKKAFLAEVMQPEDFQADIFTIFQTQMQYGLAFARDYPLIHQFSESFIREKGNAIYKKALSIYNFRDNDAIDQLITLAHQKGEFRDDLPLPFIKQLVGFLFTHAVEAANLKPNTDYETNLTHLIEFMKSGLAKSPDRRQEEQTE